MNRRIPPLVAAVVALALPGCSIRSVAANKLGNAIAETGTNYSADDDPELVGEAVPFGLKTMEGLLESPPATRRPAPRRDQRLHASTASAFVQQDADFREASDLARATALRDRARKLYLRALRVRPPRPGGGLPGLPRGAATRPRGRARAR